MKDKEKIVAININLHVLSEYGYKISAEVMRLRNRVLRVRDYPYYSDTLSHATLGRLQRAQLRLVEDE